MFKRKTSAPRAISCRIVSVFSVAGPSVQMIFVFRICQSLKFVRRNAKPKKNAARHRDVPRQNVILTDLLHLALCFLSELEGSADHFRAFGRECFYVWMSSTLRFFLELGQFLLMACHHH